MKKPVISPEILILIVSVYIALVTNITFWRELTGRLDISTLQGFGYVFTAFFIILFLVSFLIFIFSQKFLLKPFLVFILITSVVLSYFNLELGVVFDKEMVRNIVENINDHNINEARELLSFPLFLYTFILGIIPSSLILLVTVNHEKPLRSYTRRIILVSCLFAIAASTFVINYKFFTFFYRQNEDSLVYITPIYPIVAVKKYIKRQIKNNYVFKELGDDAREIKKSNRKTVGIMVVGETARADRFELNGYNRQTNPLLYGNKNLVNFTNVHSCGTSTAYSVPCMFSFFDHEDYSPEKAHQYSNVLDVLNKSNINVIWEENNSSCKGVCNRIKEVNLINHPDKHSRFYNNGQYYDEAMLAAFDDIIGNNDSDTLLVLHSMGSHGPKYYNRYPDSDSVFRPYCKKASPQECNREEINNAYDNTIVYTDYFLNRIIEYLEQHKKDYDSFMMYVSDHGESLGEHGVYLHGLPNFLAPEAQTHVPFFMWLSDNYVTDNHINLGNLRRLEDNEYTHDNLSHTLLGLFNIQTGLHNPKLDIINQAQMFNGLSFKTAMQRTE